MPGLIFASKQNHSLIIDRVLAEVLDMFHTFQILIKESDCCSILFSQVLSSGRIYSPRFLMKKMACPQVIPNFPCLNEAIGMIRHLDIDLPSFPKIPERCPEDPPRSPKRPECLMFNSKFLNCTEANHTAHHHDLGISK